MIYGSYLSPTESLPKIAVSVAALDTLVALMAGLIIFSVVFSFGLDASGGPELIFVILPALFSQIPGGAFLAILFFLLITFTAITSAISILELIVAYLSESFHWGRTKALIISCLSSFALGLLNVFSNNIMAEVKVFNLTFFDFFDKLSSSYLLPVGGLLTVLYFGWRLGKPAIKNSLKTESTITYYWLLISVRFVAPLSIAIVLAKAIF